MYYVNTMNEKQKNNLENKKTSNLFNNHLGKTAIGLAVVATSLVSGFSEAGASQTHKDHNTTIEKGIPEPPFYNLVKQIYTLEAGGMVKVTNKPVNLPGAIETAKGNPIVFKDGKNTYWAYSQSEGLDYNQKVPATVAEQMVIIKQPASAGHVKTEFARLDKTGLLVDPNSMEVGYAHQPAGLK